MLRVAVAGGTGLVGRHVVEGLQRRGHEAAVLTRGRGVDLETGDGLADALRGVAAVVDATNTPAAGPDEARAFFGAVTSNLLAAEQEAGVRHHVVLSIVGVDRVEGNGHYAGKRRQEELALAGPVAATVVRATQFHEFAAMVVSWTRRGDVATVPPLLVQPAAAADVGDALAAAVLGDPAGVTEVAGPEPQDLVRHGAPHARGAGGEAPPGPDVAGPVRPGDGRRCAAAGAGRRDRPDHLRAVARYPASFRNAS